MIASIEGEIRFKEGNRLVLDVGGLGYEVFVPLRTLERIGVEGDRIRLQTYLHVREDALVLYGFREEIERRMFQSLIGVSGIGPKVALGILSVSDARELAQLIRDGNAGALVSFPGIGRKTAERIVLELHDKLDLDRFLPVGGVAPAGASRELAGEAVEALLALGMNKTAADKAVSEVDFEALGETARVEQVVREALKIASKRR